MVSASSYDVPLFSEGLNCPRTGTSDAFCSCGSYLDCSGKNALHHVPSLLLATPSFISMQAKPTYTPLSKGSSTFLLDPHSLKPGRSLLSDTPSYLGLKGIDVEASTWPPKSYEPPADPKPREPRPSLDSTRSSSTNRSVTVQRLALDLPLSRSSSLSVLLHALEDTAPGWYQSLMESASPREASAATMAASVQLPPSMSNGTSDVAEAPMFAQYGLPADMIASLDALEAIAVKVRQLPVPRPRTRLFLDAETVFGQPEDSVEPSTRPRETYLTPPPLIDTGDACESEPPFGHNDHSSLMHRQRRATLGSNVAPVGHRPKSKSSDRTHNSAPSYRVHQVAASNIVKHPKLAKTLGLGSAAAPSRLPTPTTPSRRQTLNVPQLAVEHIPPAVQKKASLKSLKAPKTPKALQSIFRSRPSAPPLPVPDYDEDDSPVRKPPLTYRFSEAGLRREDRRIDGMKRHCSSETSRRYVDPDSFLFM
ncbi:hypothetical protein BV20DRAFT_1038621 [Pilatotrama ljubarskyi]|nr:hypothetical protein BV20DRAFT_1038621 [Pilatotrama ljubarskyi]